MNRGELTVAIAAALMLAVLLGWVLRWIFGRMDATGPRGVTRGAAMAQKLREAQEARRRAEQRLAKVEGDLTARLDDVEAELASTLDSLAKAEGQAEEVRAAYREAMRAQDPNWH